MYPTRITDDHASALDHAAFRRGRRSKYNGPSIVISGVTWSKPDLEVLDILAASDTGGTRVWFFNPDHVFPDERILPGAPRMVATPALAEYSGGHSSRLCRAARS